ncbi:MAG: hypothetical protein M3463_20435, partial [Verrucomicrobiota bacterium]|nr:hypothetical protein [Verrucomicrobiota bacterium]
MNIVAALLYAVAGAVAAAIALAFVGGGLSPGVAAAALSVGSLAGVAGLCSGHRGRIAARPRTGWEWAAIGLFALFSLRAFLWLVFADGDEIKVLSPNNLGDFSLHVTYARYLANGAPFWPENPIYAGRPLIYPVGLDLFNSLLLLAGVDALRGFIWVGLTGAICAGFALWRWGGAFVLAGFLCNGGLAGLRLLFEGQLADYQADLAWKSIPLALLVTQLGLLFAVPAGLLLLCSWRARYFSQDDEEWRLPAWGEWLLYASLPVFHLHTFLFFSVLLAVWFVFVPELRPRLLRFVAASVLPASALVWLVTGGFGSASVLRWKPGWMCDDADFLAMCADILGLAPGLGTTLFFWVLNFGLLPVAIGALAWKVWCQRDRRWSGTVVFTALGVFAACCFVSFAPWEWDNTKLMLWSYLAVLPFLWSHVLAPLPRPWRVTGVIALFFSGAVSLLGGLDGTHRGFTIAFRSEVDGVARAVRGLPITERFVAWPTYNHPLLLNGRKLVLGYPGHVWSHGLPLPDREARVTAILNGDDGWRESAAALGARYLFWGSAEKQHCGASSEPWRMRALRVAAGEWGELFDLTMPAGSAEIADCGLPNWFAESALNARGAP